MGIPKEKSKDGPVKCQYVIYVLRDVAGRIIDGRDSTYGRDWNIRLYDIVSPGIHQENRKERQFDLQGKEHYGQSNVRILPVLLLCVD